VARLFGILQKKRGNRSSGSQLSGAIGEAIFFGLVLLLGLVSLGFLLFSLDSPEEKSDTWLMLLIVISLLLTGGVGMTLAIIQYGISRERRKAITHNRPGLDLLLDTGHSAHRFPSIPSDADIIDSPGIRLRYRLPRGESGFWPMLAASLFCFSWLAVSVILLVAVIGGIWTSQVNWLFILMLLASIVVSTWSCRYFHGQLQVFTRIGTTMLEISHHPLLPGSSCEGFLFQSGFLHLQSLSISLVCEEQATYRQGTDLRIESHCIFKDDIAVLENRELRSDRVLKHDFKISIPDTSMHSFRGEHNLVQWKLVVHGKPESLDPFTRSFLIIVHPKNPGKETA